MKDLKQCRQEIDVIDQQIIALFEERMNVARDVVNYKLAHQMEIFQSAREAEVIQKNVSRIHQDTLKPYAQLMLTSLMNISKSPQKCSQMPSCILKILARPTHAAFWLKTVKNTVFSMTICKARGQS